MKFINFVVFSRGFFSISECDEVMKEVTVNYFQQLHALTVTIPTQYATMCESSRLYEPGSQFMEYIKR